MKYVTMVLLTVLTIFVLVFGQTYWNKQIKQTVAMEEQGQESQTKVKKKAQRSSSFETIQDSELKSTLEKAVSEHEKANILIAGSKALGDQEDGVGMTISQKLSLIHI